MARVNLDVWDECARRGNENVQSRCKAWRGDAMLCSEPSSRSRRVHKHTRQDDLVTFLDADRDVESGKHLKRWEADAEMKLGVESAECGRVRQGTLAVLPCLNFHSADRALVAIDSANSGRRLAQSAHRDDDGANCANNHNSAVRSQ